MYINLIKNYIEKSDFDENIIFNTDINTSLEKSISNNIDEVIELIRKVDKFIDNQDFSNILKELSKNFLLIKDRKNKIDGNDKKDIHEQDLEFLKDAYNMAEELAYNNDWIRIECLDENKNMRTIEDISNEIYNNVIGE